MKIKSWIILLFFAPGSEVDGQQASVHFSDTLASGGSGPLMTTLAPGQFRMGCVSGILCRYNTPVHEVAIQRPFAISVYEVTRGEFRVFVERTGYETEGEHPGGVISSTGCYGFRRDEFIDRKSNGLRELNWRSPGFQQADSHPVVCIAWLDANAYVEWLAAETGRPYRLPSEAEWEYAARAGVSDPNLDTSDYCRISPQEDDNRCIGAPYTVAVDSLAPNSFGLYGMERNAWEWVQDCWKPNYQGAPRDGSAWEVASCRSRVLRAGGWGIFVVQHEARTSFLRGTRRTDNRTGFRVAQSPTQ